mmetsp:Transcript_84868/g.248763  ORF Transcript_84868/g.248763 Transcript_84868/m.248763 type:complete len:226 (+) Transcript_84868:965-1642(+)
MAPLWAAVAPASGPEERVHWTSGGLRGRPQLRALGRGRPAGGGRLGLHGRRRVRLADRLPLERHQGLGRALACLGGGAPPQDWARVARPRDRRPSGSRPGRKDAGPHVMAGALPCRAQPSVSAARGERALCRHGASGAPSLLPAGLEAAVLPAARSEGAECLPGRAGRCRPDSRAALGASLPGKPHGVGRPQPLHARPQCAQPGFLAALPPDAARAVGKQSCATS